MKLHIIDVESIYRRLLTITNAQERQSIYRQELLAPFEGMMRFFGGSDPLAQASYGHYTRQTILLMAACDPPLRN